jgi:beta-glucosidase
MGHALADVLLGRAEPGGRLPTTWPATEDGLPSTQPVDGVLEYSEGLRIGYRGDVEARYAFGHGLGYTTWAYEALEAGGEAVRVRLRNTGDRAGREVVQVYASRPDSAVERPARWLAAFGTVDAGPGETVTAELALPARALAHWDVAAGAFAVEPGAFGLECGGLRAAVEHDT